MDEFDSLDSKCHSTQVWNPYFRILHQSFAVSLGTILVPFSFPEERIQIEI